MGTAPGGFAAGASGFLTGEALEAALLGGLTSFTGRREVTPGLDPDVDSVLLDDGCFFVRAAAGLGFAPVVAPLTLAPLTAVSDGPAVGGSGCCET